jgi:DNA invertase Pin-like site-specific DNA recombinase
MPRAVTHVEQVWRANRVVRLYETGKYTYEEVAKEVDLGLTHVYRILKARRLALLHPPKRQA